MTSKLVKLGSLKGPKGEDGINGLTIKGELEPAPLGDSLFPYDAKINDAYVISRNAKDPVNEGGTFLLEYPSGAKRGDVYVCVEEASTKTSGDLEVLYPPVFEKKFNISWYGEYNDIHIMSTYDNYVVEGYDTDNVKVNDIIIDNGNTLNSRLGNIYKVINVIEEPSDENNEGWEIVNWDDLKTGDKVIITGYDSDFGTESGPIGLPIFPEKVNSINTHKAYELDITDTTANSGVYNISPKDTITKYTGQTLSIDDFIFNVEIPNEELQQIAFYVYNPYNQEDEKKYYLQVNGKTASTLRIESSLSEETKSHLFELETDSNSVAYNYIKSLSTRTDNPVYISLYSAKTDGILGYVDWRHYAAGNGVMANQKFKIYRMKTSIPSATPKVIVDTVASVNISQRNLYHSGNNISVKNNTISALGYNHNVSKLSFSEGNSTATGANSHAEGILTTASGVGSHAEGDLTIARGYVSHAEGYTTLAHGEGSHAEGRGTKAISRGAHAEGGRTSDILSDSIYKIYQDADEPTKYHLVEEEGFETYVRLGMCFCYKNKYYYVTKIEYSDGTELPVVEYPEYPEGYIVQREPKAFWLNETINETSGEPFTVDLQLGISYGVCTHSEGKNNTAYKDTAHAEGNTTRAVGNGAHAEGVETCALENYSHAEGQSTISVGQASHAEGIESISSGNYSHAEGAGCIASGYSSHAEGFRTEAISNYSHAEGICNLSNNGEKFDKQTISSIGIGSVEETKVNPDDPNSNTIRKFHRKNAVEVMRNGDVYIHGIGDYDGTNSVVEEGAVKAKTLQEVIKENELPQKENELIYFDEEDGFISSQLMYSEGLVVDNDEDLEYCQSNAETSLSTVLTDWTAYGSSESDNKDWGYCNSIPDADTNPETCTVTLVGKDSITVPPFKLNGEPQDYIFNTTNTSANTGFFTPKKYSNYDVTVCVGSFSNDIDSGHDYLGNLIAINSTNSSDLSSDFYGISLHTLLLYPDGNDGVYESRPNYAEKILSSRDGIYEMPGSTIQITSFIQKDLNSEDSYNSHENNIPILSISEGLKIVPLKDYDPEIHKTNGDSKSYGIQSRVIRRGDVFTIYFSDAYRLYEDDGITMVDDSNYSVDKNRSVIIDLSNYTLKYTYYNGDEVETITKEFENGLGTTYINPIGENTEYTEEQINKIRAIFDNIKSEAHRGFESKSTENGFFRYVSGFDEKLLDVRAEKNCVYKFENGNWNITGENPFDLLKNGSRLAWNKRTNKLFYNDGVSVYQIASLSEGNSGSSSGGNNNSGSSTPMINVTYSELKSMRDSGTLTAGMQYRITDYVATTIEEGSMSANHPFDIIVTANSANVLDENARAIQHEGDTYFSNCEMQAWKLNYCIDNDTNRWNWADETNGKGVVYRMIDEFNNDVGYDFKGILFKRCKITGFNADGADLANSELNEVVGKYAHESTTNAYFTVDTADFKWFYLFSLFKDDVITDYSVEFMENDWQGNKQRPTENIYTNGQYLLNGVHIVYNSGRPAERNKAEVLSIKWTCEANCSGWDCGVNSQSWYAAIASQSWKTTAASGFISDCSSWQSSGGAYNVYVGDFVGLNAGSNAMCWFIGTTYVAKRHCKLVDDTNPYTWNTKIAKFDFPDDNYWCGKNSKGEIVYWNPADLVPTTTTTE